MIKVNVIEKEEEAIRLGQLSLGAVVELHDGQTAIVVESNDDIADHIPLEDIGDAVLVFILECRHQLLVGLPFSSRHLGNIIIGLAIEFDFGHEFLLFSQALSYWFSREKAKTFQDHPSLEGFFILLENCYFHFSRR